MVRKIKPTNDLLFKKAFATRGKEHITKALLKDMLKVEPKELYILNPYNIDDFKDGKASHTIVDVLIMLETNELIHIELQNHFHDFLEERTLFYPYRIYVSQYGDKNRMLIPDNLYSSLNAVHSLVIHDFHMFKKEDGRALRTFVYKDKETNELLIDALDVNAVDVSYLNLRIDSKDPIVQEWLNFFNDKEATSLTPWYILELREELAFNNLSKEEQEMAVKISDAQAVKMAEISTAKREGHIEGRTEGFEEAVTKHAVSMYSEGIKPSTIAKVLNITQEELLEILSKNN